MLTNIARSYLKDTRYTEDVPQRAPRDELGDDGPVRGLQTYAQEQAYIWVSQLRQHGHLFLKRSHDLVRQCVLADVAEYLDSHRCPLPLGMPHLAEPPTTNHMSQ